MTKVVQNDKVKVSPPEADCFPRGGDKKPSKDKRKRCEIDNVDLFGCKSTTKSTNARSKRARKSEKAVEDENEFSVRCAQILTRHKLSNGLKVIGVVKEIRELELHLELPHGVKANVSLREVSDDIASQVDAFIASEEAEEDEVSLPELGTLFNIGDIVLGIVIRADPEGTIELSMRASLLNDHLVGRTISKGMLITGSVHSQQDHGYIIDIGLPDQTGFLTFKKAPSKTLSVGSFVHCVLEKDAKESMRVLPVSSLSETVASAVVEPSWALPLACLVPGVRVSCTVRAHLPDGVLVSFLGFFSGTIDLFHLPHPITSYAVGASVDARILFVSVERRVLALSARPELLSFLPARPLPGVGSFLEEAKVIYHHPLMGVIFDFGDNVLGACPKAQLPDDKRSATFEVGSEHRVRILSTRDFDHSLLVSLRPSVLDATVICATDLKVGMKTKAVITNVASHALFVLIADRIKAMCPRIHTRDVPPKQLESRFKKDQVIDFRVLCIKDSKVRLTAKSTLIESEHALVCDHESTAIGTIAHGTVSAVKEGSGVFVSFYGDAFGVLPMEELPVSTSLTESYYVGQVLTVRVVGRTSNMLRLSLDLDSSHAAAKSAMSPIICGDVCSAKIISVGSEDGSEPTRLRLAGGCYGQLPLAHLTDHVALQESIRSSLAIGTELNVLVLKQIGTRSFLLSLKPSLHASKASGELPLEVGKQFAGYVANVKEYGVFVAFANGESGLVPSKQLAEDFVGVPSEHFSVGDSLSVRVESITNGSRIALSAVALEVQRESAFISASTYFDLFDSASEDDDGVVDVQPGHIVEGTVTLVKKVGVCFNVSGLNAFAVPEHTAGAALGVDDEVSLVVLDVDRRRRILDVSARSSLLTRRAKASAKGNRSIVKDTKLRARVELVKDGHVCLSARGKLRAAPLFACTSSLGPLKRSRARELLSIGDELSVSMLGTTAAGRAIVSLCPSSLISHNSSASFNVELNSLVEVQVNAYMRDLLRVNLVSKPHVKAVVHLSNIVEQCVPGSKQHLQLEPGSRMQARVLAPPSSRSKFAQLSLRPSHVANAPTSSDSATFSAGDTTVAFLHSVTPTALWFSVAPGLRGLVASPTDLSTSYGRRIGECFSVRVVSVGDAHLDLELLVEKDEAGPHVGELVGGKVVKKAVNSALLELSNGCSARVSICDLDDDFSSLQVGSNVSGAVVGDGSLGIVDVSLRAADIAALPVVADVPTLSSVRPGDVLRGFVSVISHKGCLITVSRSLTVRALVRNLSDDFIADFISAFPPGKRVECKVTRVDSDGHVLVTLKRSEVAPAEHMAGKLQVGQVVSARVENVVDFGVFVRTESHVKGLVYKKHVFDDGEDVERMKQHFEVNDAVRVKCLSIDTKSGRIRFSLKYSDVNADDDDAMDEAGDNAESAEPMQIVNADDGVSELEIESSEQEEEEESDEEVESGDDEEEQDDELDSDMMEAIAVAEKVDVNAAATAADEASGSGKGRKRSAAARARYEEERLAAIEATRNADGDAAVESHDYYERLVASQPNSSLAWCRYMAFELLKQEVSKARKLAERALDTISFREDKEKFNIWIALLNLENLHGDEDSMQDAIKRALQHNDMKQVYLHLVQIYERTDKFEAADGVYRKLTNKFAQSAKVWTRYAQFKFRRDDADAARALLYRALKALAKRKHVAVITSFALMEFKVGSAERGRTILEGVLSNYPKRVDLWSVYLDQEIRIGEVDRIRRLFERVIRFDLSTKKMKFFFKRYLQFEKQQNDPDAIAHVKQAAQEFVASKLM